MTSFKTVSVLGAGMLGTGIIHQLSAAGFDVTVLSRNPSSVKDLPSGVKVAQVDYDSDESLTQALKGQDVVVATFGFGGIPGQQKIIDASIAAGVKRYIPADWGSFTTDPKAESFPPVILLTSVQKYLKQKAESGKLEYTIFSVGGFLEYILDFSMFLDLKSHSVQIYDDGQHTLSTTSISGIGKAVAGALKKPEESKNRNLFFNEAVISQARIVAIAKKLSPPETKWTETKVDGNEEYQKGLLNAQKNPYDTGAVYGALRAALLSGQFTATYPKVDNELVGLSILSDEELEKKFADSYNKLSSQS